MRIGVAASPFRHCVTANDTEGGRRYSGGTANFPLRHEGEEALPGVCGLGCRGGKLGTVHSSSTLAAKAAAGKLPRNHPTPRALGRHLRA